MGLGSGDEKVGVDEADAEVSEAGFFGGVVDSVGGDFKVGGSEEIGDFWGEPGAPDSDELDARRFSEGDDVFWGPVGVGIKSVDDGFPRVDLHNPVEHGLVVDLDDEAVKDFGVVNGICVVDEFGELMGGVGLVGIAGVGDEVGVGELDEEVDEPAVVKEVITAVEKIGFGAGGSEGSVGAGGDVAIEEIRTVGGNSDAVVGGCEIDFKNAMTERIIEKEGFVGVSIGGAKDAAKGVGDVGVLGPGVVESIASGV